MKPSSDPIWRYFKKVLRTEYTFSELIFAKNRSINERYDEYGNKGKIYKKGAKLNDLGFAAHITVKDVKPEEIRKTGLSKEAFVWLHNWSWSEEFWKDEKGKYKVPSVPKELEKELSKYKPSESVILYRGTKNSCEDEDKRPFKSYTYKQGYAEAIAGIGDYAEDETRDNSGRVIEEDITPDKILVDFTKIPHYEDYFVDEVIVRTKVVTYNSGGKISNIRYGDLPEDMRVFISQYFEDNGKKEVPKEFTIIDISLSRFPEVPFNVGDRGKEYAKKMIGKKDLPPIIVSRDTWIDGRHRVYAAKSRGDKTIKAIDLSKWNLNIGYNLGKLKTV